MSPRVLRRLREEKILETRSNENVLKEVGSPVGPNDAARKAKKSVNPFGIFAEHSQTESENENKIFSDTDSNSTQKRKKKKKKRKRNEKTNILAEWKCQNLEHELNEKVCSKDEALLSAEETLSSTDSKEQSVCIVQELNVKLKNLNPNNELKKFFGSTVIDTERRRIQPRRVTRKCVWFINPKENWPPMKKTGLSMKFEKKDGVCSFTFVHNEEYQKIQRRFLRSVNSFNQENISAVAYSNPYHVDSLIQLSDLYKLTDDLQVAADLTERALYSLESAFHPLFNVERGNCRLDYRRQENRALFICLFKHLTFIGQKACYKTALELCKLLLSFDFELDPLGIILCIDFYALRSRNYHWLIEVGEKWENKKQVFMLPNFTFSIALAHFLIAKESVAPDFYPADELLQKALISFPGMLNLLLEKCSARIDENVAKNNFFDSDVDLTQSLALAQLITLYVHRTYCEWKRPEVIQWVERNARVVLERVASEDSFVKECFLKRLTQYSSTPRNVLRHIILTDIKEVTATIAPNVVSPILSFDPLPPLDSVDLYSYDDFYKDNADAQSLASLFLASILPSFEANNERRNRGEAAVGHAPEAAGAQRPEGEEGAVQARDAQRDGVLMLLDTIGAIVASISLQRMNQRDGQENDNSENNNSSEGQFPNQGFE